jgi:hypothetical protein
MCIILVILESRDGCPTTGSRVEGAKRELAVGQANTVGASTAMRRKNNIGRDLDSL